MLQEGTSEEEEIDYGYEYGDEPWENFEEGNLSMMNLKGEVNYYGVDAKEYCVKPYYRMPGYCYAVVDGVILGHWFPDMEEACEFFFDFRHIWEPMSQNYSIDDSVAVTGHTIIWLNAILFGINTIVIDFTLKIHHTKVPFFKIFPRLITIFIPILIFFFFTSTFLEHSPFIETKIIKVVFWYMI
jgi:hypothetical protein